MKEILKDILSWLETKVSYADLRFVQTEKENIEVAVSYTHLTLPTTPYV